MLAPLSIDRVTEARMVDIVETVISGQYFVTDRVEIRYASWEPRHLNRIHLLQPLRDLVELLQSTVHIVVSYGTLDVKREVNVTTIAVHELAGSRLNPCHVHVISHKDVEHFVQHAFLVVERELEADTVVYFP